VIYIATDRSESGTNSMITEDLRLYVARILRDHGIGAVGRPAAAGAGVAASAARTVAAAPEVLGGGTGGA
jgi:hypothetical protein